MATNPAGAHLEGSRNVVNLHGIMYAQQEKEPGQGWHMFSAACGYIGFAGRQGRLIVIPCGSVPRPLCGQKIILIRLILVVEPDKYSAYESLIPAVTQAGEYMAREADDKCVHGGYPLGRSGRNLPDHPLSIPSPPCPEVWMAASRPRLDGI